MSFMDAITTGFEAQFSSLQKYTQTGSGANQPQKGKLDKFNREFATLTNTEKSTKVLSQRQLVAVQVWCYGTHFHKGLRLS